MTAEVEDVDAMIVQADGVQLGDLGVRTVDLSPWATPPHVTAVVVAHHGTAFLPRALAALAAQTRPPDRSIAVDTGSGQDDTSLLAESGLPTVRVGSVGFGEAVSAGLAAAAVPGVIDLGPARDTVDWVWLVHDDCAPAPDALEQLLAAVEIAPSVAVAGCKQVSWHDHQRLRDVGFSITALGAVVTGVEPGEVDQGQHDQRTDVMAVRTAGMLVRRDVWDALAGPDPALTGARADLDLCRRARLAGHRVVVVPAAVVAHAAAGSTGGRPGSSWYRADRRDLLTLRLVAVSGPLVVPALVWSAVAAVLRFALRVVLKQPLRAVDELAALGWLLIRPDRWLAARSRARRVQSVPTRALRRLCPTLRQSLRLRRDQLAAWIVPADRVGGTGAHAATLADPAPTLRRWPVRALAQIAGALPVLLLTGLAAGWAARRVLTGSGAVVGPYLPPAPDDWRVLRQAASASWRAVGLGAAGIGDPLNRVLADGAVLVGGDPGRLIAVLLVGGPVLAALTAWVCAQAVTGSWLVRAWAALCWAGAPPLLAATLTGRPGAVIAHVVLPVLALALWRSVGLGSPAATAAAGLLLTLLLAAAPSLTVAAVAVLVVLAGTAVVLRTPARTLLVLVTAIVPAVLLAPWWVAVWQRPALLSADPALGWTGPSGSALWRLLLVPDPPVELLGVVSDQVAAAVPAPWRAAGLTPDQPELAAAGAVLVIAPIAVLAAAALLRWRGHAVAARLCWAVVLIGLAVALAGERAVAGLRAWPGPGLSLAALGLLLAALLLLPAIERRLRPRSFGIRHLITTGLAVACALAPAVALVGFGLQGAQDGRVTRARVDPLPAVAVAEAQGPGAIRTLALAVDDRQVRWTLMDADGARLGEDSVAATADATSASRAGRVENADRAGRDGRLVTAVVGALLSDSTLDVRDRLADLAVGSVVLFPPVDEPAVQSLDNAPGLVRVATSSASLMWRVEPAAGSRPARVRVLAGDGDVLAALPVTGALAGNLVDTRLAPGPQGRSVVVAERADPGWSATVDGVALAPQVHAGWAQAFAVPVTGGRLEIRHSAGPGAQAVDRLGWLRWAVLVFTALMAAPLPRVARRVAAPSPARRSRPVVRDPSVIFWPAAQPAPQVFDDEHPEDGDLGQLLAPLPPPRRGPFRRRWSRSSSRSAGADPGDSPSADSQSADSPSADSQSVGAP